MRLIIAEKPSMGRSIAQALGIRGAGKNRSYIEGRDTIVTWAVGHLVELAYPEAYDPALKQWAWGTLPILPERFQVQPVQSSRSQLEVVLNLIKRDDVTEIVNACDAAREGEYIFGLIHQVARSSKPVLRLWTKSLTDDGIRGAYASMKPSSAYAGLRDAAYSRSEADWLLGINGSRAQTLFLRNKGIRTKGAAPIGRVQTPVLNLLYQRRQEIDTFVPEDFWTVLADFQTEAGSYTGKWFRIKGGKQQDRLSQEEHAATLIAMLRGKPAQVVKVEQKDVRKQSELLYDLTTLQREANKRFGFSAEKTLQIAQALYETHKILSYPRTDSRHIGSSEAKDDLPKVLRALESQDAYAGYVNQIREWGTDRKPLGKRYVDNSKVADHTAILPTEKPPTQPLSPDERKIYDLVVRRTLAMYFPERIEAKSTIYTAIGSDKPQHFKTTGTVCKQEGWSAVDPVGRAQAKKTDEEDDAGSLPDVKKGDPAEVKQLYSKKGQTTPPKEYTEDTLLGAMETAGKHIEDDELKAAMKDSGLGTPATRAATIERLIALGFVKRQRKNLEITAEGVQQIESIEIELLKSPELTGEWEAKLSRMARGEYDRQRFMAEIAGFTREVVDSIRARTGTAEQRAQSDGNRGAEPVRLERLCPRCEGTLLLRVWQERFFSVCEHRQKGKKSSCKVAYPSDEQGVPEHTCKHEDCGGPVYVTSKGGQICVLCDRWQGERPESGEVCNRCKQHSYVVIEFQKRGKRQRFLKCEHCQMTRDVDAKVLGAACPQANCGGDLIEQKGKHGRYRRCAQAACGYTENVSSEKRRANRGKPGNSPWTRTPTEELCPGCGKQNLSRVENTSKGTVFHGCPDRACNFTRWPDRVA